VSEDQQLLERWCDGDDDAGDALLTRFLPTVYRFFRRRAPHVADDLAQRTFLQCVEHRERLRDAASTRAFLLGVGRHVLLQHLRATERRDRRHERAARAPPSTQATPSRAVAAREEHRLLHQAMETLPDEQRLVLELHYWEQLTTKEIGTVLAAPAGTIKWRLSRARDALRQALESMPAPEPVRRATVEHLDRVARELADP
jgi:RNA polymerase sigma-70 factor (ECF subfamily)